MELKELEDYAQYATVKEFLKASPHWVYVTANDHYHNPTDLDDPEIYKRLSFTSDKHLSIVRRAEEKLDAYWDGLNPRTEVVIRTLLPKNQLIHVRYEVRTLCEPKDMSAIIFQFMDHNYSDKTLPVFALEMRDKVLRARWNVVKNDSYTKFDTYPLAPLKKNEWYNIDISAVFSPNKSAGMFEVYVNGVSKWVYHATNASASAAKIQMQYGLYGKPGVRMENEVRMLRYNTL